MLLLSNPCFCLSVPLSYVEKFTDFLRLFVSVHLRRIESNAQFPLVEFLALLFKYTFNQVKHLYLMFQEALTYLSYSCLIIFPFAELWLRKPSCSSNFWCFHSPFVFKLVKTLCCIFIDVFLVIVECLLKVSGAEGAFFCTLLSGFVSFQPQDVRYGD